MEVPITIQTDDVKEALQAFLGVERAVINQKESGGVDLGTMAIHLRIPNAGALDPVLRPLVPYGQFSIPFRVDGYELRLTHLPICHSCGEDDHSPCPHATTLQQPSCPTLLIKLKSEEMVPLALLSKKSQAIAKKRMAAASLSIEVTEKPPPKSQGEGKVKAIPTKRQRKKGAEKAPVAMITE